MSPTEFEITDGHIELLRAMCWRWDDTGFGAPGVDPKRPFGFSGGHLAAVASVLGEVFDPDNVAQENLLMGVYRDTLTVLRIVLSAGCVAPGVYRYTGGTSNTWYYNGPL
jgi:hypothetical protein